MPIEPLVVKKDEELTHAELKAVCDRWGLQVCPKARVADMIRPERNGLGRELTEYCLMAHFDFVVCKGERSNRGTPSSSTG